MLLKKCFLVAALWAAFAQVPSAHAVSFCSSNQWSVAIDVAGDSNKEDLLHVFDLLGRTIGIQTGGMQSIPDPAGTRRFYFFAFNPGAFITPPTPPGPPGSPPHPTPAPMPGASPAQQDRIAQDFVDELKGIPGTSVSCSVHPSVSGSN